MPALNLPPMRAQLRGALEVDPAEKRLLLHVATIYTTDGAALVGVALANFARWQIVRRCAGVVA
jgi:hypothetical protein